MISGLPLDAAQVARARGLLLGGWRDIADDVERLRAALDRTPDECRCGHGHAHLAGTCPCCTARERPHRDECDDCMSLLAHVGPKMDLVAADTLRYLPTLLDLPAFTARADLEEVQKIERGIANLVGTFRRLIAAVAEFERGCSAAHLTQVKHAVRELAPLIQDVHRALGLKREAGYRA
jgi:hypothetical protein